MRIIYVEPGDPRLRGHAGFCDGLNIYIDERYKDDKGLLEHEKTHRKQFLKNPLFWHLKYKYSKKWRSRYEVEAYAVQAIYAKNKEYAFRKFGEFMATKYGLDYSSEEFERRIRTFYFRRFAR